MMKTNGLMPSMDMPFDNCGECCYSHDAAAVCVFVKSKLDLEQDHITNTHDVIKIALKEQDQQPSKIDCEASQNQVWMVTH